MIIDITKMSLEDIAKHDVIDLATGVRLPLVQKADSEKGLVWMYLYDIGNDKYVQDENEDIVLFCFKTPIKIIKKEK